ncbi:hypothetical protein POM88_022575 [Heracleum sosnowskyi]|uniref:sucrose synthase n=1 Tax=Heracleum sosnowskyi TaxID=360622 RepID=A0AAD8MPR9_9APIA|nr:hypothetical protein POM88_022575 [Heracleum sosnowskyi]
MFQENLINAWSWLGHFGNANILACLLITTLLVISWFTIFFKSKNPNPSLPPGPRSLPLVGNLLSLDPDNLHTYFANLAQTYGPIMKLQLGQKALSSRLVARTFCGLHTVLSGKCRGGDPYHPDKAADLMAEFFQKCTEDPAYWEKISEGGLQRIYERYTWKIYSERLVTLAGVYSF